MCVPRDMSLVKALHAACLSISVTLTLGLGSGDQSSEAWSEGPRRGEGSPSQLPSSGY